MKLELLSLQKVTLYRIILAIGAVLWLGFGAFYRLSTDYVDPLTLNIRLIAAFLNLALVVLSYSSDFFRKRTVVFVYALLYIAWGYLVYLGVIDGFSFHNMTSLIIVIFTVNLFFETDRYLLYFNLIINLVTVIAVFITPLELVHQLSASITLVLISTMSYLLAKARSSLIRNLESVSARYQNLVESMPVAIAQHKMVFDEAGEAVDYVFLEVNNSFEEFTGLAAEEIIGRRATEVLPSLRAGGFDWVETYAQVVQSEEVLQFESYSQPLDRWYYVSAYSQQEGYFTTAFIDITKRKQSEQQLQEQKNLLEGVINGVSDILAIQKPDHTIERYNEAGYELLGLTPEEVKGQKCYQLLGQDGVCELCATEQALETKQLEKVEKYVPEWDRYLDCRSNPVLDQEGNVVWIVEQLRDITQRKKSEKRLKEAKALLEKLTEQVPGALYQYQHFTDGSSCFPFASQGIYDVYAVTPAEIKEDAEAVYARIVAEDYDRVMESILESRDSLEVWHEEYRVDLPQKGVRWLEGIARPEKLADDSVLWHGYIRDITERKKKEKEQEVLMTSLNDIIMELDEEYRITSILTNDEEGLFFAKEELLGGRIGDFFTEELTAHFVKQFEKAKSSKEKVYFEYQSPISQEEQWFKAEMIVIKDIYDNDKYLVVISDITKRKQAEKQLKEAVKQAEAANKAKSKFLANMSHEIRTPLNAVIGFSEILKNRVEDAQQKDYLDSIQAAAQNLLSLINDILDLSKIEAGLMEIEFSAMNLKKFAQEIEQIFAYQAQKQGLDFILEYRSSVNQIKFAETRLRQILLNLIGNAIKFTEEGYIKVVIAGQAKDSTDRLDLTIRVEDTGIGIAAEEQEEIFASFSQSQSQKRGEYEGTGLGLAIVRKLVELLDGELSLESTQGVGSSFKLYFAGLEIVEKSQLVEQFPLAKLKFKAQQVLIVDDVASNRELLKVKLASRGLEVIEAVDGQEGVEKALKLKPELVLMDLKMPKIDGYQARKLIREEGLEMPIIALTAYATQEEKEKVEQAVFEGFLTKPINDQDLFTKLSKYLDYYLVGNKAETEATKEDEKVFDLEELINTLKVEFREEYEELTEVLIINQIEDFADRLLELAQKQQITELINYASQLKSYAENFALEELREQLATFPVQIEKLEAKLSEED
ncbi:PAS domain S-box protein [Fuchsiella alkaliacetigena]|uniref:PAS domain S-box protein n=1 Tax=Fuchsiella alkaliacetigena TaxID=957042 RepID=UPI00200AB3A3|nr:PAS domain S-box protein [Fuchsiella alkaliacetigena]MCK8825684.1 PAS domain S-box protein [Fuchsiella alkaliacetigena]